MLGSTILRVNLFDTGLVGGLRMMRVGNSGRSHETVALPTISSFCAGPPMVSHRTLHGDPRGPQQDGKGKLLLAPVPGLELPGTKTFGSPADVIGRVDVCGLADVDGLFEGSSFLNAVVPGLAGVEKSAPSTCELTVGKSLPLERAVRMRSRHRLQA